MTKEEATQKAKAALHEYKNSFHGGYPENAFTAFMEAVLEWMEGHPNKEEEERLRELAKAYQEKAETYKALYETLLKSYSSGAHLTQPTIEKTCETCVHNSYTCVEYGMAFPSCDKWEPK
jgi:hypothetical protein